MGLTKLDEIVSLYKRTGRCETGIAIISNGSLPNEEIIRGTISNIQFKFEENPVPSPAIIVVGEVVNLQDCKELFLKEVKEFN